LPGSMYATPLLPAIGNLLRCDGPTTQGESCDDVLADARAPRMIHCAPPRTDTQIQGSAWAARDRRVGGHAELKCSIHLESAVSRTVIDPASSSSITITLVQSGSNASQNRRRTRSGRSVRGAAGRIREHPRATQRSSEHRRRSFDVRTKAPSKITPLARSAIPCGQGPVTGRPTGRS